MPYLALPQDLCKHSIAIAYSFCIHKTFRCSSHILHIRTVLISVECSKFEIQLNFFCDHQEKNVKMTHTTKKWLVKTMSAVVLNFVLFLYYLMQ